MSSPKNLAKDCFRPSARLSRVWRIIGRRFGWKGGVLENWIIRPPLRADNRAPKTCNGYKRLYSGGGINTPLLVQPLVSSYITSRTPKAEPPNLIDLLLHPLKLADI